MWLARSICLLWIAAAPVFADPDDPGQERPDVFYQTMGLGFPASDALTIELEEIVIGPSEIRGDYMVRNTSDQTVTGLMSLPMPPFGLLSMWGGLTEGENPETVPDLVRLFDLDVTVDGKAVPVRLGIASFRSQDNRFDEMSQGWSQIFPPGGAVRISYRHRNFSKAWHMSGSEFPPLKEDYCVEVATSEAAARAMILKLDGDETEYSLGDAYRITHVWQRTTPAETFRLRIEPGVPGGVAAACAAGLTRSPSAAYEWGGKDFTPTGALAVLVVAPLDDDW
jgi:hypothetical protein